MSPRVEQNGSHLSKKWMGISLVVLFVLPMGDFEWRTDVTEVVLDVKLASLGVLNISPRGLTDSKTANMWLSRIEMRLCCVLTFLRKMKKTIWAHQSTGNIVFRSIAVLRIEIWALFFRSKIWVKQLKKDFKNSNSWNKKDFQILISDSSSSGWGWYRSPSNSNHDVALSSLYLTVLSHI